MKKFITIVAVLAVVTAVATGCKKEDPTPIPSTPEAVTNAVPATP